MRPCSWRRWPPCAPWWTTGACACPSTCCHCCTPWTAGRTCCLKSRQSGPLHALVLPGLLPSPSYSGPHVSREFDEAQFLEFVAPCFQQLAALLSSASEFDSQARGSTAICLGAVWQGSKRSPSVGQLGMMHP